jgi:hypothetical protein
MIVDASGIFLGLRTRERACLTTSAFVTPVRPVMISVERDDKHEGRARVEDFPEK